MDPYVDYYTPRGLRAVGEREGERDHVSLPRILRETSRKFPFSGNRPRRDKVIGPLKSSLDEQD